MSDIYSETEVYHTLDLIGKGTFGKVFKCWRGSDGEIVAVKTMKNDANRSRIIKNELKLTAVLSRSNLEGSHIVHFIEGFRDQRHHYLVFEMLEKNLYEFQKDNGFSPLPVRNIRTITCQVLRALAKLKEMAIIHADIKPENIMIVDHYRYPFRVKLIDFGSASIFSEVRFVQQPYIQSRFYRSPEILLGLPFCEKVDMWSLGCVMAELLLGCPLYPGNSEFDQVRYICETQGLPSFHLLNMASKTSLYFKLNNTEDGAPTWVLRQCASSCQEEGEHSQTSKRGKYVLSSLDQLCNIHITAYEMFTNYNVVAEGADRHCMVELIKRALTIDSHQRINPSAALRHPFTTLAHLHGPGMQRYYEQSLQELQTALIPKRSSTSHNDDNGNPQSGYKELFHHFQDQHVCKHMNESDLASEGNMLSNENKACQHCPEGDHCHKLNVPYQLSYSVIQSYDSSAYDPTSEVSDLEYHEPCYKGQTVLLTEAHQQSTSLKQVQNTTWKMEGLSLTDTEAWGNTLASWPGELPAGPGHNNSRVISELQTWPNPTETTKHGLVDFSLTWHHTEEVTHAAYILTNMLGNPQPIRQPNARPSRSDPTGGLRHASPLQMDAGSAEELSTGSFGNSQMLTPQVLFSPMQCSAEELCNPPQLFIVESLPSNQELLGQGQHRPPQCSYTNLKPNVHLVPYEAEACHLHGSQWPAGAVCNCSQWPAGAVCNPEPSRPGLHYDSSTSPSYSTDNYLHH